MRNRLWIALTASLAIGAGAHAWLQRQPLAAGLSTIAPPRGSASREIQHPLGNHDPAPLPSESKPDGSATSDIEAASLPALSNALNLLVVGLDRRPGQKRGGRPDTLIVAVFSEGRLGLVSVPRDLYAELPGWGHDRINASFAAARQTGEPPLTLLQRVVEDTLEVPIAHTVAIDLGGFERAIDALGGIDVQVRCPIVDDFLDPRTPSGRRRLNVAAGKQSMDGVTAAMYARSRHGRSDWSRARRQQAILFGIRERATTLGGLARLPSFSEELESLLLTDMTRAELLSVITRGLSIEPNRIHGLVLGHRHTEPHRTADGKAVLLPKHAAIRAALSKLFTSGVPGALEKAARCAPADAALRRNGQSLTGTKSELAG